MTHQVMVVSKLVELLPAAGDGREDAVKGRASSFRPEWSIVERTAYAKEYRRTLALLTRTGKVNEAKIAAEVEEDLHYYNVKKRRDDP